MREDICEGGTFPDNFWLFAWGNVYGWRGSGVDLEDPQGWYFVLKLPAYQWFAEREMWYRETWAQRILIIRHVFLGRGRRGKNGAGWQGWNWSVGWKPVETRSAL